MNLRSLYHLIFPYELRFRLYKLRHQKEIKELRSHVYPSTKGDFSLKAYDIDSCIFVHITKTAGTSVAKSLFEYLPYHYTAIEYRVIYGKKDFDRYFKFAFVRNPWDRLYSAYRYLIAGGWNDADKKWADDNIAQFSSFEEFIVKWLNKENIQKHLHFKPQFEFICDTNKNILIDYLAYFETLEEDFNNINNLLKKNAKLGFHNANPGANYKDAYSDNTRNIVANVYDIDIKLFGYDFNGIQNRITLSSNK